MTRGFPWAVTLLLLVFIWVPQLHSAVSSAQGPCPRFSNGAFFLVAPLLSKKYALVAPPLSLVAQCRIAFPPCPDLARGTLAHAPYRH